MKILTLPGYRKYVALKACVGTEHPVQNNEVRILQWIHQHGCGKLGFENIVELHDAFTIRGPNGFHEIIITEVIVPMSGLNRLHDFEPDDAICQIISGLSFLHSERVAHGGQFAVNYLFNSSFSATASFLVPFC